MANAYVKSLIWLLTFGGIGYGLMIVTEPSEEKLNRIRNSSSSTHLSNEDKNKLIFLQKLKEAASSDPIYFKKNDK